MTPWRPILHGPATSRAWDVILELAAVLAEEAAKLKSASYSQGSAGISLFYTYLAIETGDRRIADQAAATMDLALAACASTEHSALSLLGGISGVAWAYRHVNELLTGEVSADLTDEVDTALLEAVRQSPWQWEYDLFFGLAGLGLYALDHPDRRIAEAMVSEIVTRLEELALPCDSGVSWLSQPELTPQEYQEAYPEGRFDLCLAHGVAGVIGFLSECCRLDFQRPRAERLLQGAVEWLLAHKRPEDEGSTFSAFLDTVSQSCRSAWCYGDPGICASLLSAARALHNPSWQHQAILIGLKDCRRPLKDSNVTDAQVCHGAAGLAHVYNRIYQATGHREFCLAAERWLERTLDMREPGQGIGGYLSWWGGSREWKRDPALLSGAAGIGLSLLAAVSGREPGWDRPLLLPAL